MKNRTILLYLLLLQTLFVEAQNVGVITYDDFTQMPIEIKFDASNYVQYIYDGNGKRIRKIRHLSDQNNNLYIDTTLYIYGTHGLPLSEKITGTVSQGGVTTTINREKLHIYGHEYGSLAMEETSQQQQLDYFIRDHQSSLRVAVKSTDNSASATINYDPFGKEISRTADVGFNQRFSHTYTGQEYDIETQTYNYRRRLYSPSEKQFLQPDPKHINFSPYTFTNNNPVNYVDKDGNAPTHDYPPLKLTHHGYEVDSENEVTKPMDNLDDYEIDVNKEGFVHYKKSGDVLNPNNLLEENSAFIYTMDSEGRIFAPTREGNGDLYHSEATYESPVAAGELEVRGGRVAQINEASGHFKPHNRSPLVEKEFKSRGAKFTEDYKLHTSPFPPVGNEGRVSHKSLNAVRKEINQEIESRMKPLIELPSSMKLGATQTKKWFGF